MPPVLSFDQVADLAYGVGLRGNALATAVAIAKAESQHDAGARGDTTITTSVWGPSIGLWQIRSLNAQKGTGGERDELANVDPGRNARAMYGVSAGGTNWRPWSVFQNSAHRAHMAEAEAAAGRREASGGSGSVSGGGSASGGLATTVDLGTSADVVIPAGSISLAYTAPRLIAALDLTGSSGRTVALADSILGGRVELTTQEASEISLELVNVDRHLWGAGRGIVGVGARFRWLDLTGYRVAALEAGETSGVPTVSVAIRPSGIASLKAVAVVDSLGAKDSSPTEWLGAQLRKLATADKIRLMGQGSARRPDIAPTEQGDGTVETAWQMATRMAGELGYWIFEADGILYFGKPTWLAGFGTEVKVALRSGAWGDERLDTLTIPKYRESVDSDTGDTLSVELPRWRGEQIRPGMRLATRGIYGIPDSWIVTRVSYDIDPAAPVTVEAAEPKDPKPSLSAGTGADATAGTGKAGTGAVTVGPYSTAYEKAAPGCSGKKAGMERLMAHLLAKYPGTRNGGTFVCKSIGTTSTNSQHSHGRAGDLMVPVNRGTVGDQAADYLIRNAAVFGIQQLIWNRRDWRPGTGWTSYTYPGVQSATGRHEDHVHLEQTTAAAAGLTDAQIRTAQG